MADAHAHSLTAVTPFQFYTSFVLQEATGFRAATLPRLVKLLHRVPEACIYHHTHYFLLSHHYLTPEPTHDFAYWVTEVLGDEALGERLASIDILEFNSLAKIRVILVKTIEDHLAQHPTARFRFVSEGEEFFFIKSVQVVMPTQETASSLAEFAEALSRVSLSSLYFHIFDARLRLGRSTNDFARWCEEQLGETTLAKELIALDPYAHSLEALRSMIIALVRQRVG
ncbi:MAG: hypothetical protein HY595_03945 [Candidatus Omnitrophica bacterium]|nr:hypothetical protein [Candidatus Omnitrophota bacterium]